MNSDAGSRKLFGCMQRNCTKKEKSNISETNKKEISDFLSPQISSIPVACILLFNNSIATYPAPTVFLLVKTYLGTEATVSEEDETESIKIFSGMVSFTAESPG